MADTDTTRRSEEFGGHLGGEGLPTGETYAPTDEERRARTVRNVAIALGVVGFVVLVYLTTFFRMAASIEAGRAAGV